MHRQSRLNEPGPRHVSHAAFLILDPQELRTSGLKPLRQILEQNGALRLEELLLVFRPVLKLLELAALDNTTLGFLSLDTIHVRPDTGEAVVVISREQVLQPSEGAFRSELPAPPEMYTQIEGAEPSADVYAAGREMYRCATGVLLERDRHGDPSPRALARLVQVPELRSLLVGMLHRLPMARLSAAQGLSLLEQLDLAPVGDLPAQPLPVGGADLHAVEAPPGDDLTPPQHDDAAQAVHAGGAGLETVSIRSAREVPAAQHGDVAVHLGHSGGAGLDAVAVPLDHDVAPAQHADAVAAHPGPCPPTRGTRRSLPRLQVAWTAALVLSLPVVLLSGWVWALSSALEHQASDGGFARSPVDVTPPTRPKEPTPVTEEPAPRTVDELFDALVMLEEANEALTTELRRAVEALERGRALLAARDRKIAELYEQLYGYKEGRDALESMIASLRAELARRLDHAWPMLDPLPEPRPVPPPRPATPSRNLVGLYKDTHRRSIKACGDLGKTSKFRLAIQVGTNGHVRGVQIVDLDSPKPDQAARRRRCIVNSAAEWTFPASADGYRVNWTVTF